MMMIWGIHLGTHGFIYDNGGPYGHPAWGGHLGHLSPGMWWGWHW